MNKCARRAYFKRVGQLLNCGPAERMIRLTLIKGRYRVEALRERSRQWLAGYAAAVPSLNATSGALTLDPRFIGDFIEAARCDGIAIDPTPHFRD